MKNVLSMSYVPLKTILDFYGANGGYNGVKVDTKDALFLILKINIYFRRLFWNLGQKTSRNNLFVFKKIFANPVLSSAIIDRIVYYPTIIHINVPRYVTKNIKKKGGEDK